MNRSERRRRRNVIINKRISKLKTLIGCDENTSNIFEYYKDIIQNMPKGYYANNNIMNQWMTAGCSIKTNTRKGHSNYRRPGFWGPAMNYTAHDKKQIQDMRQQMKEYKEKGLIYGKND